MAKEFIRRDMETQLKLVVTKTIIDAFYDFQTSMWHKPEYEEIYKTMERWFCTFLKRYGRVYAKCDTRAIAKIGQQSREYHYKIGCFLMETETLGGWLKHMMNDVEPFDLSVLDVDA